MSGPVGEPDLGPGDRGDEVSRLQTRLQIVGHDPGALDGDFGEQTERAVRTLRVEAGLGDEPVVDAQTWQALAAAEDRLGVLDSAPTGSGGDLAVGTPVGTVSEDQHWRWDGEQWQPNEDRPAAEEPGGPETAAGEHVSADGHWRWDGNQWQPV